MTREQLVSEAAGRWSVPYGVLWGVYGVETSHGSDVTTSSAGAKGSFQFIESTARSYGYPYSNATDEKTFAAQADAAAHYLHDLFAQTGSWDSALHSYSGGGYGLAQVKAQSGGAAAATSGITGEANAAGTPTPSSSTGGGIGAWLEGIFEKGALTLGLLVAGVGAAFFGVRYLLEPGR